MIIEIKSNEIWDDIKDDVHDAIQDSISDLEFGDLDDIARAVKEEVECLLEGECRYIVEDIVDSMIDYKIQELDTSPINQAIHDLEQKVSKLQSQIKLANFKLRRSK